MRNTQTITRRTIPAVLFFSLILNLVVRSDNGSVTAASNPRTRIAAVPGGKFNGKIAFSSDRHNSGLSIWTMNTDGSSPTRLTDEKSRTDRLPSFIHIYDSQPAWSPDGTKIAFRSNRDNAGFIYTMNADGTNLQRLTNIDAGGPAWSPDGSKIAFIVGGGFTFGLEQTTSEIYSINPDGSGLTKLTTDTGANRGFSWSPDGRQIAFASTRDPDGRSRIWVMNSDGSNQRRLTDIHDTKNAIFYQDVAPSWSPDGAKILFTGSRDFNGTRDCYLVNCSELFVMNADGSNDHAITGDPNRGGIYMFPKWSPDGTKIATSVALGTIANRVNGLDLGTAIIVMDADGGNPINLSYRSDLHFVDAAVDWQPVSAPVVSSSSIVGFSAPAFSAFEDARSVPMVVKRTGNLNLVASCSYATQDGTATVRNDYAPAFGTVRFAPGEASKTISISITDNASVRGSRSFKIALSDNEGNATFLGSIREATVTVMERDSAPRPNNPIDETRYFVRQHYVDFLSREPDEEGLDFWSNEIESCGSNVQCREVKQINVSAAFYLSIEFQETGYFVYRFNLLNPHNVSYAGFPDVMRQIQEISNGIVVGRPGWHEQLESSKLAFVQRYYDDDRLVLSFGRTDEQYVDLLFEYVKTYSGITLPVTKRDNLIQTLQAGIKTRSEVLLQVADDEQFKAALFNQVFVLMQYWGYLRRDPDNEGYDFWLRKLDQFNGNYINAEMIKAFINSIEYRSRFA
ncbi:MAG TPA: Calx-beta domain-containing protein [Pyrinomonadaceae bacterium]|nr:Calx-beta domain-containing protein [Pyrinomonadaceae bacterium]